MGKPLNVTYYFGQIRPQFRGDLALFMDLDDQDVPTFRSALISTPHILPLTEGMHSPLRAYIGVNCRVQQTLVDGLAKKPENVFALDNLVVRPEIVERRYGEICDMVRANTDYG